MIFAIFDVYTNAINDTKKKMKVQDECVQEERNKYLDKLLSARINRMGLPRKKK